MVAVRRGQQERSYGWAGDAAAREAILLAYYEEERLGQTVRHYYYKLLGRIIHVTQSVPRSADNAYKKVSQLITQMRRDGSLPWRAVVDPSRRAFTHYAHESLEDCLRSHTRAWFSADIWRGQPRKLEVWVEKDAMADFVDQMVGEYRIAVHVAKGFGSATIIKEAAERYGNGKSWTLLYCGDFDPSGLDIERSLRDTLHSHGSHPEIVRVALTHADTFAMPAMAALPLKRGDPRYKRFVQKWGAQQKGFELDALPAHLLREKLLCTIDLYFDREAFQQALRIEQATELVIEDKLQDVFAGLNEAVLAEGLPVDWGTTPVPLAAQRMYLALADADNKDGE